MPLTLEQVQHIANLARLELSAEELTRYRDQLSAILDYFKELDGVETENIPASSGLSAADSPLRADLPRPGLDLEDLLKNAPDTEGRQFRVPPVFD